MNELATNTRTPARWLTLCSLVLVLILGGVLVARAFLSADDGWRALASTSELASEDVMYFPENQIFLVHRADGGRPVALSAIDPHRGHHDYYCRRAELFQGDHGEIFDRLGFYYGGPAPRGLDRYPVRVVDRNIEVNIENVIEGASRSAGEKADPPGDFCHEGGPEAPEGFFQE